MRAEPSVSRVAEWLCRGTVIGPVAVKFGEAVGQAHSEGDEDGNGVGEAVGEEACPSGEEYEKGCEASYDGDGVVVPPKQPATEAATIKPVIASLMPE
jgi:hypothetical protein